jgi:hypothetical protein
MRDKIHRNIYFMFNGTFEIHVEHHNKNKIKHLQNVCETYASS